MQLNVSAWGNSLGLRIPRMIAKTLGIQEGTKVEAHIKGKKLLIVPPQEEKSLESLAKEIDLKSLVSKVTLKNRHSPNEENPAGNEVW